MDTKPITRNHPAFCGKTLSLSNWIQPSIISWVSLPNFLWFVNGEKHQKDVLLLAKYITTSSYTTASWVPNILLFTIISLLNHPIIKMMSSTCPVKDKYPLFLSISAGNVSTFFQFKSFGGKKLIRVSLNPLLKSHFSKFRVSTLQNDGEKQYFLLFGVVLVLWITTCRWGLFQKSTW